MVHMALGQRSPSSSPGTSVTGITFGVDDLVTDGGRRAVLDCTSGWYSEHEWRGLRVGDLFDAVEPTDDAE